MPSNKSSIPPFNYLANLDPYLCSSIVDQQQVWLFQCKHRLEDKIIKDIDNKLGDFLDKWESHGTNLQAQKFWFFAQFLLILIPKIAASGCAIDQLFKQIKKLELDYSTGLLERNWIAVWDGHLIKTTQMTELHDYQAYYFFDNSVHNWGQFRKEWLKPIAGSYLEAWIRKN